jgi:hypothetical protein
MYWGMRCETITRNLRKEDYIVKHYFIFMSEIFFIRGTGNNNLIIINIEMREEECRAQPQPAKS